MKKTTAAQSPEVYVAAQTGWQQVLVKQLRAEVRKFKLDEVIKWGHLVYYSNGPVLLIRAAETRVLFGFWRGQRLRELEPRLKPGGKYEMATVILTEGAAIDPAQVRRLVDAAVKLNQTLGDPTAIKR